MHQFSVDSDRTLYAADSFGERTQEFRPCQGQIVQNWSAFLYPLMAKK
jgi:hypothetical protein